MATTIKKNGGTKTGPLKSNRIQTIESTLRLLKEVSGTDEFYELEPLEVLDVHLDETKSSFPTLSDGSPDYSFIGGVIGRFCTSEQGLNIDKCKNFKPINKNLKYLITDTNGKILKSSPELGLLLKNTDWKKL